MVSAAPDPAALLTAMEALVDVVVAMPAYTYVRARVPAANWRTRTVAAPEAVPAIEAV
jgi:hypothetical protein